MLSSVLNHCWNQPANGVRYNQIADDTFCLTFYINMILLV